MADKKEHGPHPMALLREWKLDLNPTLQKQAKTELEYYKLADLLTCLLLHSPTLNAGKIRFTVSQSQLAKLQGTSDKTIYTRLKRLETMTAIEWEQPKAEGGGYQPAVFTVSRKSVRNKKEEVIARESPKTASVSKKDGVPSVELDGAVSKKQEFTDGDFTDTGLKGSGHSGQVWSEKQDDTTDASLEEQEQEQTASNYLEGDEGPVDSFLDPPIPPAPRRSAANELRNWLPYHDWVPAQYGPVCSRCGKDKEEVKMSRDPEPCEPGDEIEMPKSRAFQIED